MAQATARSSRCQQNDNIPPGSSGAFAGALSAAAKHIRRLPGLWTPRFARRSRQLRWPARRRAMALLIAERRACGQRVLGLASARAGELRPRGSRPAPGAIGAAHGTSSCFQYEKVRPFSTRVNANKVAIAGRSRGCVHLGLPLRPKSGMLTDRPRLFWAFSPSRRLLPRSGLASSGLACGTGRSMHA